MEQPNPKEKNINQSSSSKKRTAVTLSSTFPNTPKAPKIQRVAGVDDLDDDDAVLYGPSDGEDDIYKDSTNDMDLDDDVKLRDKMDANGNIFNTNTTQTSRSSVQIDMETGPTYWCIIYRHDGALEIFSLPHFEQRFFAPHFDLLPSLVWDKPTGGEKSKGNVVTDISELVMCNLGSSYQHRDPYLIVSPYLFQGRDS